MATVRAGYSRRGHPFLGIIGLDGAARGVGGLEVGGGHGDGGHWGVELGVVAGGPERGCRERDEAVTQARRVARGGHGGSEPRTTTGSCIRVAEGCWWWRRKRRRGGSAIQGT